MLAVVRVDTVGFFRRALEWMHNNFTIYVVVWWCIATVILVWNVPFYFGVGFTQELGFQLLISAAHIQGLLNFNKSGVKYKSSRLHFRKEF